VVQLLRFLGIADTAGRANVTRIVVTGLGAVSGFGRGIDALWRGLVEGRRATALRPELDAAGLHVGPIALVPELPFSDAAAVRAECIAAWAAEEAVADAGLSLPDPTLALTFGTTKGGIEPFLALVRDASAPPPVPPARASYAGTGLMLAARLGTEGPIEIASVACTSSNVAMGNALDLLRRGEVRRVLAGGADALSDFVVSGFATLKALDPEPSRPFDRTRRGLNLGEGAAFLVLEREADALARGARVRATLLGYGLSADAVHMTGPDKEGRGAARAMIAALAEAGVRPADLDFVSAHGTGTIFNDLMEDKALRLALGEHARTRPLHSIKSALGHTLGAAGALEAAVCVRAIESGMAPATVGHHERDPEIDLDVVVGGPRRIAIRTALSTSSGFGGTNAAIVLGAP
jgi:3-oxoacyl-[acyl-carrier-protein] synthase II